MGGIFLIQSDGGLVEMTEEAYESEDVFQELLARYPNLLAGDQIDSSSPRRWLLVSREIGVPDAEDATDRWSLDHLFLDQDSVPTLVEVKRSSDTRIRREVVGQMLDYAANSITYWSAEGIRAKFEANCEAAGKNPEEELTSFLGEGADTVRFWESVKTNMQAGKMRLLFVAEVIPIELRRIVEFLNRHMQETDVLAIEIRQFVGQEQKALVPRVIGQTVERKAATGRSPWSVESSCRD